MKFAIPNRNQIRLYLSILLPSFLSFNSIAQSWTKKADFINGNVIEAYAFAIGDTIYVGGGSTSAQHFFKYDPVNNKWGAKTDVPGALKKRTQALGFAINNKGYVMGGMDSGNIVKNDLWEYDPSTDSWTKKADCPGGPRYSSSCFVIGNNVYIYGGLDTPAENWIPTTFKNTFWKYDQTTNVWTQKSMIATDTTAIAAPFAFAINGKGYVACGRWVGENRSLPDVSLSRTYQYDTSMDSWTLKSPFPGTPRSNGVSFVIGNKAYCGFGGQVGGYSLNDFFVYDPSTDTWDTSISSPFVGRALAISACPGNGTAYVGTGNGYDSSGIAALSDWWEFSPSPISVANIAVPFKTIDCYPNPSQNVLYFNLNGNSHCIYQYTIFNMAGQKVLAGTTGSNVVNTQPLPEGNYILLINKENEFYRALFSVKKGD